MQKFKSWDEYFSIQSERSREMLNELREIITEVLLDAEESWGYGVPAYNLVPNAKLDKKIMIAGFKNHVSFYPSADTIEFFKEELTGYKVLKGTIQFMHKQKLPRELIKSMILHRYKTIIK